MNDFLTMLIIFTLLMVVTYFSHRYVNSKGNNTLNIIIYIFAGVSAVRLSEYIDILPTTIVLLFSITMVFIKYQNKESK